MNSIGEEEPNWKHKTPALTNINIASSVHKYHSGFPPIGHPTDNKNYQEKGRTPVLHSFPFSEMAENIMFDSMPGAGRISFNEIQILLTAWAHKLPAPGRRGDKIFDRGT